MPCQIRLTPFLHLYSMLFLYALQEKQCQNALLSHPCSLLCKSYIHTYDCDRNSQCLICVQDMGTIFRVIVIEAYSRETGFSARPAYANQDTPSALVPSVFGL